MAVEHVGSRPRHIEHQYPVNYAQRGLALEGEGTNRSVNVALPTLAQRQASDPLMPGGALSPNVPNGEDLLPGQTDADAPDGPDNEINTGYLWNNALRAGLTVRDYGFFIDTTCYNEPSCQTPLAHDPFLTNTIVAPSANVALTPSPIRTSAASTRRFRTTIASRSGSGTLIPITRRAGFPILTLVRFMHDHTGNFSHLRLTASILRTGMWPTTTTRSDCWCRRSPTAPSTKTTR
jgi:ribosomal protein L28